MRHPGFVQLVGRLAPGGRLRSVRRLKGGLGATMHVLDIEKSDGTRFKVSLRRLTSHFGTDKPEKAEAEFARLQLAAKAGIPAPEPLLLDSGGELFGVPALVLSYVPGAARFRSFHRDGWTAEFAAVALRIHAVTPAAFDLSGMSAFGKEELLLEVEKFGGLSAPDDDALFAKVRAALLRNIDRIEWIPPCLIHGDFWPGNTVWYRGHLAAVIDWSDARLGDRRSDVTQCQIELAFTTDLETSDRFVQEYEAVAGSLPQLWFFQLYRSMIALVHVRGWLSGYADVGLRLDGDEVVAKLRLYAERAMADAAAFETSVQP